jgi:hypothetical protein
MHFGRAGERCGGSDAALGPLDWFNSLLSMH